MSTRNRKLERAWILAAFFAVPAMSVAQVPVDQSGQPVGQFEPSTGAEELTVLSAEELEALVGPVALYPDDLLAIVLPASTYPLQIVQAARFLEDLKTDSSLKPDDDWDDSVVALTNYPEVVEMMNKDLDWTWRLGEAVVAQQTDVIQAIEAFRDRAYASGNLKSDEFQTVTQEGDAIQITPVEEDVIYVPYYEPERVVVYQPRPVYYYYPRPYPVYYYPYPLGYSFYDDYFWGVTTAFSIGWFSRDLHVWHSSYYGHPYYGRHYWYNNWWYRRPDIHVYNNYYVRNTYVSTSDRYRYGDTWRPQTRYTVRSSDQRVTRTRYYPGTAARDTTRSTGAMQPSSVSRSGFRDPSSSTPRSTDKTIKFRDRPETATLSRNGGTFARPSATRPSTVKPSAASPAAPQRPTTVKPASRQRQSFTAPLARPSTATRSGGSRLSTDSRPGTTYAPAAPRQSFSQPSAPKQSYSVPSRSRPSYAPQATQGSSRSSAARPQSAPSQSFSRSSQSRAPASGNSKASRSSSSSRSSKR